MDTAFMGLTSSRRGTITKTLARRRARVSLATGRWSLRARSSLAEH
jgi:hypothetical protein